MTQVPVGRRPHFRALATDLFALKGLFMQSFGIMGPSIALIAIACLPRKVANRHPHLLSRICVAGVLLSFATALFFGLAGPNVLESSPEVTEFSATTAPMNLAMLSMISLIGFVVAVFSRNYLAGDPHQGNFYRWLCVTLGSVLGMATSGSLSLFALLWCIASIGSHQLLRHFQTDREARRLARFQIGLSLIADGCLAIAVTLVHSVVGSTRFDEIASFAEITSSSLPQALNGAAALILVAVVLRTVQFPFHHWLQSTLSAPTPVSALLHAGIVNAGGFLLISLSALMVRQPVAMAWLTCISVVTVLVGAGIMMTQNSVKASLVYSTVAQMGFMLFQVSVGAFAGAFVHLIAHSLYKAYSFLSSGTVTLQSSAVAIGPTSHSNSGSSHSRNEGWLQFAVTAIAIGIGLGGLAAATLYLNLAPTFFGEWCLHAVAALALTSFTVRCCLLQPGRRWQSAVMSVLITWIMGGILLGSYTIAHTLVSCPEFAITSSATFAALGLLCSFALMVLMPFISAILPNERFVPPALREGLYQACLHRFYVDAVFERFIPRTVEQR